MLYQYVLTGAHTQVLREHYKLTALLKVIFARFSESALYMQGRQKHLIHWYQELCEPWANFN